MRFTRTSLSAECTQLVYEMQSGARIGASVIETLSGRISACHLAVLQARYRLVKDDATACVACETYGYLRSSEDNRVIGPCLDCGATGLGKDTSS